MQFTVLIEFLIPGLATVLLGLALLPSDFVLQLPKGLPTGDTPMALVLLAISYPVGHLVNFPVFLLQRRLLVPEARRRTAKVYLATGVDLAALASQQLGFKVSADTKETLRELFKYMQTIAFCRNIEQFNSRDLFHKSIQRLARGLLFPLLLAAFLVLYKKGPTPLSLSVVLVLLASTIICIILLRHFLRTEEDEIARFFVTLTSCMQTNATERPTQGLNRTAPLRGASG